MAKREGVLHPIIYVRGYAMSRSEINDTTADPFCGFNVGSTVFRAAADPARPPRKYIFESPVIRLSADFGYTDVFTDGLDVMDDEWDRPLPRKSIVIYRYYDPASTLLGEGTTPKIEEFGRGLSRLIATVRKWVCEDPANGVTPDTFRCYLLAHSMGGLVCRSFLQNPALDEEHTRSCVDKFFTFATPHNGIDLAGQNVPEWLTFDDVDNFNRQRMAEYLDLKAVFEKTRRVDWMSDDAFRPERIFCLIGTNRTDYEAAKGLSRTFVGHGSDGLVRIEHAWLSAVPRDGQTAAPVAKAFVYRSHSGYFGIVNSEESYQNLVRFLFGDLRVDIWIDVEEIRLPADVQAAADEGKTVDALYQFEVLASPRGKLWYLTRRVAEEDSVACLRHQDWVAVRDKPHRMYVSSVFLDQDAKVNPARPSLAYSMTLGVRAPDYEVERRLWLDAHYEGGYLFRDSLIVEVVPPLEERPDWVATYGWQSETPGQATQPLEPVPIGDGRFALSVTFGNDTRPGIRGRLRFVTSRWNAWNP